MPKLKLRINDNPLLLYPDQATVLKDPARFKLIEAGRRWGKTITLLVWLIQQSMKRKGEMSWYIAPQFNQAHDIAWELLLNMLPRDAIEHVDNRKLTVTFAWKSRGGRPSRLALKGSDKPDSLRGVRLAAAGLDEAAFQKSFVYDRVVEPMLADLQAPMLAVSSPKVGWFTKMVDKAREGAKGYADYKTWHFTIYDNPFIRREEIERIRSRTPEHEWLQEYMAQRVDFSGVVYPEFDEGKHIYDRGSHYRDLSGWKKMLGIDWGSDDPTGVTWGAVAPAEQSDAVNGIHLPAGGIICTDEHMQNGWDPARHCRLIHDRSDKSGWELSHENTVIDQSTFRQEAKDRLSIADDFRKHLGFTPSRSIKNLDISQGYLKIFLRNDWIHISSKCRSLIAALRDYEWGDHEPDVLASFRYLLAHAIQRRFSRLIAARDLKSARSSSSGARLAKLDTLGRLQKPGSKKASKGRFQWDKKAGVPIIKRRLIG